MDLLIARAREVAALNHAVENPQSKKLIFQKLPIHMKRRAMSHDPKRMPKRLREGHIKQMEKSGLPPKSKRPSRKYRRRPNNLLSAYNKRQRLKIWLQTHIWHAKRFHMIEKWGYKIAHYNNSRGYRANYRAVSKYCMIQDISYYHCIELVGPSDEMVNILKLHCKDGLTFGAKYYLRGNRQGSLTFYKKNGCPIGVINFLYRPNTTETRTIWLWIHPALYKEVIGEIMSSFDFEETLQSFDDKIQNKMYHNKNEIKMKILTNSLNRFRLCGDMAISVVTNTLRLPTLQINPKDDNMETDVKTSWYESWYKDSDYIASFNIHGDTFEAMKTLNSPSQLPRHCVIGATVLDPRYFCPSKKTKSPLNSVYPTKIHTLEPLASCSALWDSHIRENVDQNCKTTREINEAKAQNLVPGVSNDSEIDESTIAKIPVILIQTPGTNAPGKSIGFTSGIDIILPAKWGLPFWLSFMYRCPRPGGLYEARSIIMENLLINSPEINHPDTAAYASQAKETREKLVETYFRYPPNRRVNFVKCAISSPFFCEWKILVKEWTNEERVSVLRDRNIILSLTRSLSNHTPYNVNNENFLTDKSQLSLFSNQIVHQIKSLLVAVKITIERKGNPKDFALICLPTDEDIEKFHKNPKWGGPVQKSKIDAFQAQRKILKMQHQSVLKRARRERKNAKKACKIIKPSCESATIVAEHATIMKNLYLPECIRVRDSCDRQVMGYVVQGGFSCSEAKGVGWGYVVVAALLNIIEKKNNIVLVRNTKTRQYRCAKLEILNLHI